MGSIVTEKKDVLLFFYKRRPWPRPLVFRADRRSLGYFTAMLLLIGLAGWLYLYQASAVAGYSREIRGFERRKERLRRELIAMQAAVAMAGSLEHILQVGSEMDYRLPSASESGRHIRLQYRSPDGAAATREKGLADQASAGRPSREAILGRLVDQLEVWLQEPVGP